MRLLLALYVFVGALQLMKTGAASLSILHGDGFLVENAGSTLGLGWLGALLVLSGSPVAATSLTLVAGGEEAAAGARSVHRAAGLHDADGLPARSRLRRPRDGGHLRLPRPRGPAQGPDHLRHVRALRDRDDLHPGCVSGCGAAPVGHVPLDQPAAARQLHRSRRSRVRPADRPRRGLLARARLPRRARLPAARVQADRHGAAGARPGVVAGGLADPEVADVPPGLAWSP